jgi:uncharacterized membrane protein
MRLLLLIAFILFIFGLIVASGTAFLTGWNVWLLGGLSAWVLDLLIGDRIHIG